MMRVGPPLPAANVCWQCQWRLANQRRTFAHRALRKDGFAPKAVSRLPRRALHATRPTAQVALSPTADSPNNLEFPSPVQQQLPIRQQLEMWEKTFGEPDELALSAFENHPIHGDIQNNLASLSHNSKADEDLDEDDLKPSEEDEGEELITIGLFLKPGDVVELSQPGREPVLAVFVRQLDLVSQFYSVNGRWCHSRLASVSFAVPGCVDPALLQPILPYMPTKPGAVQPKDPLHVPRELGAPIQAVLQQLTEESERIYRTNAPVLDTAYSTLADATRTRMMTLPQITKSLLGKGDPTWAPSPSALLAVRKALNHNEYRFRSDSRSQRLTNVFAIRPKNDVEVVETVHEWVREFKEYEAALVNNKDFARQKKSKGVQHIEAFVSKARRLISQSRKFRKPSPGSIGPDQAYLSATERSSGIQTVLGEEFTSTDQQIINFLQAWVLTNQYKQMPNLHSACTSILHAVGCYGQLDLQQELPMHMTRSTGSLLLQEIGVITPFEDQAIYDESLMLPTVRLSRNLELLNAKVELTRRNPDFQDAMADLRRDWGSDTVYCIDAPGAKEIDDGISIERVPGKPSEYWVHVHVANPTAFFDKSHVLSGLAAHMTETVYTPARPFPMLPTWVTQNYFSLTSNRPVITFSSRIDDSGNMLEYKIQNGIVRKVVSITPAELAAFLDESVEQDSVLLAVGGKAPKRNKSRPLPHLAADQLQNLRDLYSAAQALWRGRKAAGGIRGGDPHRVDVHVYESPGVDGLTWMPPSVERARRVVGDPIIMLSGTRASQKQYLTDTIDSSNIVEEAMLLACRTAGAWCAERNIPVMYRGTVANPTQPLSAEQYRQTILEPYLEKHGSISFQILREYMTALGRGIAHSSPLTHSIIGAKSYIKATSPLRRFSDMIAHWQIEAALRYEARTAQKLNSKLLMDAPRPILPFSARQMQESIITLSPRERMIAATKQYAVTHWKVQAFMRAFYYKEAPLPETFTTSVRWAPGNNSAVFGYLEDYGVQAILQPFPGIPYKVGDVWEMKIAHIDSFMRTISMKPIRMIHRDDSV